ncbi:MAG TPA: cytochrome c oxidase assembly protein, partial [Pseudonocardia sp.]|uniref:cytochrome c oxidase assembly protein n=1 Tax=Pseudonocardia sp. TaxID=60912 RepID=UPI002B7AF682
MTGSPVRSPLARWPTLPLAWLAVAGLAVAVLTGGLLAAFAPSLSELYGLPPAEALVTAGLPAARVIAIGAAALGVGQLLLAAVLVPGEPGDLVSPAGYAALRAARWCALTQAVASVAVAVLTVLENTGLPASRVFTGGAALVIGLEQIEPATGWLIGGALAAVLAGLAGWVLTWRGAVGLLVLALAGQLPSALTSATNAERSHDIAGDAFALHTLAALLWLGSTTAVLGHLARRGDRTSVVLRRHAAIATWSLLVVGGSGLVSSAYALPPGDLLSSGFGRVVLLSAVALVALAGLGHRLRRLAATGGSVGSAIRLLALEFGLLATAAALGTGLTRLIPPTELSYQPSRYIYLIGYDLPARFSALDLLWRWRLDLVFAPAAGLGVVLYLLAARRLRRRGEDWPRRYTLAWLAGCGLLLVATSSGLGSYAPAMFSAHMVQHMLLATLAPALLVLGHGASLARRAVAPSTERRLTSLLHSPAARLASHPLIAWAAVGATLFGLYPTGLYAAILQQHWAHLTMNAAIFGTGLALFWSILGMSGGRRALPPIGQLVMIFAVMALHAAFAAWLLGQPTPVAAEFYTALGIVGDPLAD